MAEDGEGESAQREFKGGSLVNTHSKLSDKQRLQLTKGVSSFANSGGGIFVIGVPRAGGQLPMEAPESSTNLSR